MSTETKVVQSGGVGVAGLLGVVFVTLKLTHNIDWSWWWVTAPFWMPAALTMAVLVVMLAGLCVVHFIGWWLE